MRQFDWKTWWYYSKWQVIVGAAVLLAMGSTVVRNLTRIRPDYQLAYVGERALPEDTVAALEEMLGGLGQDLNEDGRVVFQVHQYLLSGQVEDPEGATSQYGVETLLMADLLDCESYFFLLENPDKFQQNYQTLALLDGSCPSDWDRTGVDKTFCWKNCPVLVSLDWGAYTDTFLGETVTGENATLLGNLYLGRRCFYRQETVQHLEGCAALWDTLTEGVVT